MPATRHPIRQFVGEAVTVVEETAEFEVQPPCVGAGPSCHPADRTHPGNALDHLDAEPDMLAFVSSGIVW